MKLGKKEINAERFSGMGLMCSAADVRVTVVPVTPGGWDGNCHCRLPVAPACPPSPGFMFRFMVIRDSKERVMGLG